MLYNICWDLAVNKVGMVSKLKKKKLRLEGMINIKLIIKLIKFIVVGL